MMASLLMQQNPFMLYAGEEYGERGMDREGFSGNDGRTTIFDYWSVDTLCRAASEQLTEQEKALYDIHVKTMHIARQEKAVAEGIFFDLMYVNSHLQRQYAFLRRAEGELLLVAVNFDANDVTIDVILTMKEKKVIASDLLTKEKLAMSLKRDGAIRMEIGANSGRVWKIKL